MYSQDSQHDRDSSPDYVSYLVRLRRVHSSHGQPGPQWRASVEEPLTQQVFRFESLQGLFAFLLAQTGQRSHGGSQDPETPPTQR